MFEFLEETEGEVKLENRGNREALRFLVVGGNHVHDTVVLATVQALECLKVCGMDGNVLNAGGSFTGIVITVEAKPSGIDNAKVHGEADAMPAEVAAETDTCIGINIGRDAVFFCKGIAKADIEHEVTVFVGCDLTAFFLIEHYAHGTLVFLVDAEGLGGGEAIGTAVFRMHAIICTYSEVEAGFLAGIDIQEEVCGVQICLNSGDDILIQVPDITVCLAHVGVEGSLLDVVGEGLHCITAAELEERSDGDDEICTEAVKACRNADSQMVENPFVLGRCIDGREDCRRCKKDCDRFFHKILCVL